MNAFMGAFSIRNDRSRQGKNVFNPNWRQYLKTTDISQPTGKFVMLDEHPDSINDGYYLNNPNGNSHWGDSPASYHNGACGPSFADGHAEVHKWLSRTTIFPVSTTGHHPPNFDAQGRQDYAWLIERTSERLP